MLGAHYLSGAQLPACAQVANGRYPVALADTVYTVTVSGCANLNGTVATGQTYIVLLIARDKNSRVNGQQKTGLETP